ncbi:MAG: hypothetical protein ACI9J3_003248 [Parvicellaceae bacterium]|jgi:hypothetical protein
MISKILFSSFLIGLSFVSFSQKQHVKTKFNKKEKELEVSRDFVHHKQSFNVHIESASSAAYNVTVKYEDYNLSSDLPAILKFVPGIATSLDFVSNISSDVLMNGEIEMVSLDTSVVPKEVSPPAQIDKELIRQLYLNQIQFEISNSVNRMKPITKSKAPYAKLVMKNLTNPTAIAAHAKGLRSTFCNSWGVTVVDSQKIDTLAAVIMKEMVQIKTIYELYKASCENCCSNDQNIFFVASLTESYKWVTENEKNVKSMLSIIKADIKKIKLDYKSKKHKTRKDITTAKVMIINRFNTKDTILNTSFDIYQTGKVKVDFSTGLFGNSIFSPKYILLDDKDDTTYAEIVAEDNPKFDIALGGLIHLDYEVNPFVDLGFVAGAALSPLDAKTRYLFGFSVSMGKSKSLSISAGYAFGKKTALSRSISLDGEVPDVVDPELTELSTYEKFAGGGFVGITYNIKRKKVK